MLTHREVKMASSLPVQLHSVQVEQPLATVNRLLAALHLVLAVAAIARRGVHIMLAPDLVLLFLWGLSQAAMWRPVSRATFPGRLSRPALPGVDVMVVTADPDKEPAVKVMNTVISAMALDYPGGRLAVYLSDDAGSPRTLLAARKAYAFAKVWVPFCRKYGVQCPCPDSFFANIDDELSDDLMSVKSMYETFKKGVEQLAAIEEAALVSQDDHDSYVEIIAADKDDGDDRRSDDDDALPSLVYVSREKRRSWPHHFKAGALNVLLRVSSLLSNAPYLLVLDCDMYCNTRSSVLEAMCFHLDARRRRADLAFVQFPQMFHSLSRDDIYCSELRDIFSTRWKGLDGLRGPTLSGSGFCVRRDALHGAPPPTVKTTCRSSSLHMEWSAQNATSVASCAFEAGTQWGHQVGFLYQSVVEDFFTSYRQLYCRGWTSVYCYPAPAAPPPFLGSVPTNLNDVLVQNKRWITGMLAVGLSKHCPLASTSALAISVPHTMAFAHFAFAALHAFPVLCYATVPQLRFFRGGPTSFPSLPLAALVFASSSLQHLLAASVAKRGLAVRTWWNEQRFWALSSVTAQLFACFAVALDLLGIGAGRAAGFDLTSKAESDHGGLYLDGVFDFSGSSALLLPATTLCLLNDAALLGGVMAGNVHVSGELFLLGYIAALSYPLLQGMFFRRDPARVPVWITATSVGMATTLLCLFA